MEFIAKDVKDSVTEVARQIGYVIIDSDGAGEYNLVKKVSWDNFPRFHIYLKTQGETFIFNIHLDQKRPSYAGSHAHSGEYFGPVIEDEVDRIEQIIEDKD
jgi:hypothetical protein